MDEQRLIDLEIRYAHQDAALNELSDLVYRQGRELDALRRQVGDLRRQLQAMALSNIATAAEETPPPHY